MAELVCATITPFDDAGELDLPGVERLFRGLKRSGIGRVFTPGTTGEFTALTDDERLAVIDCALDVFGAEQVYAHVGAATARQAISLARSAHRLGATRFAAITPYYLPAGPAAVRAYFEQLTAAVPAGEFYVYVFSSRTTTEVTPRALADLAGIPGVVGAKISGRTAAEVAEYVRATPSGFRVLAGNDADVIRLADEGVAGVVSAVAGVFPELFVAATAALEAGEDASGRQPSLDRAVQAVAAGDIRLLKAGTALRGLPAGPARVAIDPPSDEQLRRLRAVVAETRPE